MSRRACFAPAALVTWAAAMVPGCTAPVIVASAGLAAAQTGTNAYINGELEAAHIASMEQMYGVVNDVLESLQFKITLRNMGKNTAYVFAEESAGRSIKVFLERKSPLVTKSNIRVGLFGDQSIARLLMAEIHARSPAKPEALPIDGEEEP